MPLRAHWSEHCEHFSGGLTSAALGSVVLAEVWTALVPDSGSHAVVERTPRLIHREDPELYKLGLQVHGTSVIEPDGRQARLQPGDLAIYNTSRPYRIWCISDFRMTVAMFPRTLVRLPERRVRDLTAVYLSGTSGFASRIGPLISGLGAELNATSPVTATHLGDAIVDVVTATFAQRMCPPEPESQMTHRELVAQVTGFVDRNLDRPELSTKISTPTKPGT